MTELTKKERRLLKKQEKKKAKALAKRRKKIQNELDWCLVALCFLVFLAAAIKEAMQAFIADRKNSR